MHKPAVATEPKVYEWTQLVRRTNLGTIEEFNNNIMRVKLDEDNYDRYKKYFWVAKQPRIWYARDIGDIISLYVLPNGKMVCLRDGRIPPSEQNQYVSGWSGYVKAFFVQDRQVWWQQTIRTSKSHWAEEQ